jgi:hypothetical protein
VFRVVGAGPDIDVRTVLDGSGVRLMVLWCLVAAASRRSRRVAQRHVPYHSDAHSPEAAESCQVRPSEAINASLSSGPHEPDS